MLLTLLCVTYTAQSQQLELAHTIHTYSISTPFFWGEDGGGEAIDFDGQQLIYGAPYANYEPGGYFGGAVFIFEQTPSGWQETAQLTAPGFTNLGHDVAIAGDWAFAGAPYYGKLYIYKKVEGAWQEHQVIDKSALDQRYGNFIDYSDGRLVVSMIGQAFIYENINDQWTETAQLIPPAGSTESFGACIAVDGINLVVSDANLVTSPTSKGVVYHYQLVNGSWVSQSQVDCPVIGSDYGLGLELTDNYLAVSETHASVNGSFNVGQVYMYSKSGTNWVFDEILQPIEPQQTYYFGLGTNLSIEGNTMMIGHWGNGNDRAHVVF